MSRYETSPIKRKLVHWPNTLFLGVSLVLTLTAAPAYLWQHGWVPFQIGLFLLFFAATGLSITLGYHRLFTHRCFQARWPVRLLTLMFGAAAFENSVLCWAADHRRHHKFVDQEDDPYDISKGFFHAHIGWILFRFEPLTSFEYVKDLQQDQLVQWQHRHYRWIAVPVGLGLPLLLGWIWGGWSGAWGSLLIAGVARIVCVHHMTFLINSLCHSIGRRPYSSRCTARDSAIMALFTFGEGYHNFHHAFQHDYRNGMKPWQFDPTKWSIWFLHLIGLVPHVRRVPAERIRLVMVDEQQRQLADRLSAQPIQLAEPIRSRLQSVQLRWQQAFQQWERSEAQYTRALEKKLAASREKIAEFRREFQEAKAQVRAAFRDWQKTRRLVLSQFA